MKLEDENGNMVDILSITPRTIEENDTNPSSVEIEHTGQEVSRADAQLYPDGTDWIGPEYKTQNRSRVKT